MTTKCFKLKLKLPNTWHSDRILTDDVRKVRVNKELRRKDINPYVRKNHQICMN